MVLISTLDVYNASMALGFHTFPRGSKGGVSGVMRYIYLYYIYLKRREVKLEREREFRKHLSSLLE